MEVNHGVRSCRLLPPPPVLLWRTGGALGWVACGVVLLALHASLLAISPCFPHGRPVLHRPVGLLVGLLVLSGLIYLVAVLLLRRPASSGPRWWGWMILVGLGMRAMMLFSTPMLEDDYHRYLWDGAMVAAGEDPFAHAPAAVLRGDAPRPVLELAGAAGTTLERVNHPHLRTIYPRLTQVTFAIAHWIAPWRIEGLRLTWMGFDLATLLLLLALLWRVGVPASAAVVYWWNPLLIKEVYNSGHMELVILPFVLGALLLTTSGRALSAGAALGLAIGAKVWPIVLLPALLRQPAAHRARAGMIGLAMLLGGVLALPLLAGRGADSGAQAYASVWQMNDALYQLWHVPARYFSPGHANAIARAISVGLLLAWIIWLCRRPAESGLVLCRRALWIIAALFLLSPTQFPWYWLWMLPLLAVHPSPGLLVLTMTLPLYYLRFTLRELGYEAWFDHGIVWIQFLPAFALLVWEARSTRTRSITRSDPAWAPANA